MPMGVARCALKKCNVVTQVHFTVDSFGVAAAIVALHRAPGVSLCCADRETSLQRCGKQMDAAILDPVNPVRLKCI